MLFFNILHKYYFCTGVRLLQWNNYEYSSISLIPCTVELLRTYQRNYGCSYMYHVTASTLSHKHFLFIISIDFDKEFNPVKEWKWNEVLTSFMLLIQINRKINVKVNHFYSNTATTNGTRQWPP